MSKLILFFFFLSPIIAFSQSSNEIKFDELFTKLDTMPNYNGGEEELIQFFNTNSSLNFTKEKQKGGMVSINFIVSKEGKIYEPKILFNSTKEIGDEVARLILLTKWNPGIRNGKNVNVSKNFIVYIKE